MLNGPVQSVKQMSVPKGLITQNMFSAKYIYYILLTLRVLSYEISSNGKRVHRIITRTVFVCLKMGLCLSTRPCFQNVRNLDSFWKIEMLFKKNCDGIIDFEKNKIGATRVFQFCCLPLDHTEAHVECTQQFFFETCIHAAHRLVLLRVVRENY